jgi:hypothetical protein
VQAAELLAEERGGVIPIRKNGSVAIVPLEEVVKATRGVPRDLYELAQVFT